MSRLVLQIMTCTWDECAGNQRSRCQMQADAAKVALQLSQQQALSSCQVLGWLGEQAGH